MQEKKFLSLGSNPGPLNVWFPGYHWAEDKMIIDDLQVNMLSQMFQQPNISPRANAIKCYWAIIKSLLKSASLILWNFFILSYCIFKIAY